MTHTTELPAMPASISAKMHCLDYKPEEKKELWVEIQKELQLATAEAVRQERKKTTNWMKDMGYEGLEKEYQALSQPEGVAPQKGSK